MAKYLVKKLQIRSDKNKRNILFPCKRTIPENSSPEVSPIGLEVLQVVDKLIEKVYKKLNENERMEVL